MSFSGRGSIRSIPSAIRKRSICGRVRWSLRADWSSTILLITRGETLGSEIEFVRSTARVSYYLPFAPEKKVVDLNPDADDDETGWQRWFRQTQLAFGARFGVIQGVNGSEIPIDERFFNGGSNSVRSFAERDLGPHADGDPIGGEFFSVYNIEYTFPIWGEVSGALFVDAGNLLASAEDVGFDDMRYAIGFGLRYKLPIGPLRLDYGVNPGPAHGRSFRRVPFQLWVRVLRMIARSRYRVRCVTNRDA